MKHASVPDSPAIPYAELAAACRALRCPVPEDALGPLGMYLSLLIRWNRVMNLVGAKSWREALRLAADSFFLARFLEGMPLPAQTLTWDLGAGAGLPGIPLRMVWQAGEYHMVETREKRAIFLNTVLARLTLPRTSAVCERAEHFFARMIAQERPADCILSRAFMPWKKLLPFVADSLAPGGVVCIAAAYPPEALPGYWVLAAEYAYEIDGAQRFFWALRKS
ncbi:MAG: class I SAM-dependent methyltransferase [Desulfovibrionaceae bacterium]|nr:class I SAM-dependent methyltransferase [Desulfovibrionaceae bacterium]